MDLMDVPEPSARADPWGMGGGAASRAGAGAAASAADPWHPYGEHLYCMYSLTGTGHGKQYSHYQEVCKRVRVCVLERKTSALHLQPV